jgi:RimJ/RimL family protein N-acetyltransferase
MDARQRGLGKRVCDRRSTASARYAFTEMGREHVISLIHAENWASIRVAERLGETLEGRTELFGQAVLVYGIDREGGVSRLTSRST